MTHKSTDTITDQPNAANATKQRWRTPVAAILLGSAWYFVYSHLHWCSDWLVYTLFELPKTSHAASALAFFLYEVPKVLMLLLVVVFAVGIIRSFFTTERTRQMLVGRREFVGNVLAALLGIPTPFCSCSAVPLFIGFVEAGVPLGVTLSFLIAAPMVNEVALALLFQMFGWKVAAMYVGTGLSIAIIAGWIVGRLHLEKWVEEWVYEIRMGQSFSGPDELTWADRVEAGKTAVRDIVGRVWPYVAGGIAVGAAIHGYVPEDFMASFMGRGAWWSVPLAVVMGIPMYSNAAGVIPIVEALYGKGAALGTVLAFMMSVIALSLPEMVILKKVLKPKLIAVFAGVVGVGIVFVGYTFNLLLC